MKLIVGLGNPGLQYANTRHNVGFMCIDEIVKSLGCEFNKNKFNGLYAEKIINGEKIIFLKPQMFINLSGDVIKKYISADRVKILPRRMTGACAKHQRHIAGEVKKARFMALIPFVK